MNFSIEQAQNFINSHPELKNITELKHKYGSIYYKIRKNKLLDKIIFPKQKSIEDNYNTVDDFQNFININNIKFPPQLRKEFKSIYNKAKRLKLFDDLSFENKIIRKNNKNYEDIDEIDLEVEDYNTLLDFQSLIDTFRLKRPEEFKRLNIKLYNKSVKLGFNSKNLKYISYPNRYNTVKDFQDLINNEPDIKNPHSFKEKFPGVYKKASNLGLLDKLVYTNRYKHIGIDYTKYNTTEEIQQFVNTHNVLSAYHFRLNFPGLYNKLISIKSTRDIIYASGKTSYVSGLQLILENLLKNLDIEFETEKTFDWLVSDVGGFYRLDIYIPKLNLAIEGHGLQHFFPVDYFGGEEGFIKRQIDDKRKYLLCNDHNITILYFTTIEQFSSIDQFNSLDYFAPIITTEEDLITEIKSFNP